MSAYYPESNAISLDVSNLAVIQQQLTDLASTRDSCRTAALDTKYVLAALHEQCVNFVLPTNITLFCDLQRFSLVWSNVAYRLSINLANLSDPTDNALYFSYYLKPEHSCMRFFGQDLPDRLLDLFS